MTNIDAMKAAMFPYTMPDAPYEFLLAEQGIDPTQEYVAGDNSQAFYKAVIAALYQLVVLIEEKDGGSSQKYDTDKILAKIAALEKENGLAAGMEDITSYW
jgi:hypothetical protein